MRRSWLPECSRALMQASIIACAISSMDSDGIPSSRARLPAARAAAISMSGTIGSVNSICRSGLAVINGRSSRSLFSKGEEQGRGGANPLRDPAETVERQESDRVHGQQGRQHVAGRKRRFELGDAGLREVVHGLPPLLSGLSLSNATATRARSALCLLS